MLTGVTPGQMDQAAHEETCVGCEWTHTISTIGVNNILMKASMKDGIGDGVSAELRTMLRGFKRVY